MTNLRARAIAFRVSELNQILGWRDANGSDAEARRRIVAREREALEALPVDCDDATVRRVLADLDREEREAFQAHELARLEAVEAYDSHAWR